MFLATAEGLRNWIGLLVGQIYQAATSLGGPGLFLVALADSSFLSLPEGNDVLIVILSTGQGWTTMAYYVAMTALGSVSGCALLYAVGRRGGGFFQKRLRKGKIQDLRALFRNWGAWSVLIPSILPPPTPFKVFVLSAGLFQISLPRFLLAVLVGRTVRYSIWGVLAVLYGEMARDILEEHLHTVGAVLFLLFVAAITGYVVMWLRTKRKASRQEVA